MDKYSVTEGDNISLRNLDDITNVKSGFEYNARKKRGRKLRSDDRAPVQDGNHKRTISLKDLCPSDKMRVANLVRELAKISTEKEEVVSNLQKERETFLKQKTKFTRKQDEILKDRQGIQAQLLECQRLLSVYQIQLLHLQKELAKEKKQKAASVATINLPHQRTPKTISESGFDVGQSFGLPQRPPVVKSKSKKQAFNSAANDNYSNDEVNSRPTSCSTQTDSNLLDQDVKSVVSSVTLNDDLSSECASTTNSAASQNPADEITSPSTKRSLLLQRRESLVKEQERLQRILAEQEKQLELKRAAIQKQEELQKLRLRHFEKSGEFPSQDSAQTPPPTQRSINSSSRLHKDTPTVRSSNPVGALSLQRSSVHHAIDVSASKSMESMPRSPELMPKPTAVQPTDSQSHVPVSVHPDNAVKDPDTGRKPTKRGIIFTTEADCHDFDEARLLNSPSTTFSTAFSTSLSSHQQSLRPSVFKSPLGGTPESNRVESNLRISASDFQSRPRARHCLNDEQWRDSSNEDNIESLESALLSDVFFIS